MVPAEGSAVMLLSEDYADSNVWSWWRRGRVELPVQKNPQTGCTTSLFGGSFLAPLRHHRRSLYGDSRFFLGRRYRRGAVRIPDLWRLTSPIPGIPESRRSRFRRLERIHVRQLFLPPDLRGRWHPRLAIRYGTPLSNPRVPMRIYIVPRSLQGVNEAQPI